MSDPGNAWLTEELTRTLDGLFGRRLVLTATAPLARLPWALRATACSGGLVALTLLVGAALAEPRALREIDLWAGLLLLVTLVAYESLARQVKRVAGAAIIPALSPEAVARARAWSASSFLLSRQAAVCLGIGLLTAAPLIPALRIFVGHHGLATLGFIALGSAVVTSQVYIPASISLLSLLSTAGRVELFPLDPNHSPLVVGLRRIGQQTVMVTAAMATVGALGPLLLPGLGPVAYVLSAMVLFGAVAASAAQFFVQQYALGTLLARARNESMVALQHELAPLFARRTTLSEDERGTLESLLQLYDRVLNISTKVFTPREALRFAGPMLVPTVTMILTSLHIELPEHGPLALILRQLLRP
jgi:hypothetical protein